MVDFFFLKYNSTENSKTWLNSMGIGSLIFFFTNFSHAFERMHYHGTWSFYGLCVFLLKECVMNEYIHRLRNSLNRIISCKQTVSNVKD